MIKYSTSLSEIIKTIDTWSNKLEINKQPKTLYDPINYFFSNKGKKIRSTLTLLSNHLFNGHVQSLKPIVLAIEALHNFTLIHDDVMDNATLRRGQPTINKKWSRNQAILSGDVLMISAYEHLLKLKKNSHMVVTHFTQTSIDICEGQQLDLDMQHKTSITLDEYYKMISLKTGCLIQFALTAPCYLDKEGLKYLKIMDSLGYYLGQLFQIQDDYLDLYGEQVKTGKLKGGDILENKKTFLYAMGLSVASLKEKLELETTYHSKEKNKLQNILTIYSELNIETLVSKQIEKLKTKIFDLIKSMDLAEDKKKLILEFITIILNRKS